MSHPYMILPLSVWPTMAGLSSFLFLLGMVGWFHQYPNGGLIVLIAFTCIFLSAMFWWRTMFQESDQGHHTSAVRQLLVNGMWLFIVSEFMFFIGFIWAFTHTGLDPTVHIQMSWPPIGIIPVEWWGRPVVMSLILGASYFTANLAVSALTFNRRYMSILNLFLTILLGIAFLGLQWVEYSGAPFTISDSVFGSNFFMITGIHGLHVFIGLLFLTVCLIHFPRLDAVHNLSLYTSVLYWHFVDIIWILVVGWAYIAHAGA